MAAIREARAVWNGDLMSGSGVVSAVSSGKFSELPVSWSARTEAPGGRTSPEELLAAAHASCFAMALSAGLARGDAAEASRGHLEGDVRQGRGQLVSGLERARGEGPGPGRR